MVTLAETTELSEMHDAVGKWTQLWPSHKAKNASHKETQSSHKATQSHVSVMQTTARQLLQTCKKYLEDKFVRNSAESGCGGGGVVWCGVVGGGIT